MLFLFMRVVRMIYFVQFPNLWMSTNSFPCKDFMDGGIFCSCVTT